MIHRTVFVLLAILLVMPASAEIVIFADYSDPDVIRVGSDYYLISSSFQSVPGLPILHSRDLVSWTIVGYAAAKLPPEFDRPQHGDGLWAPSIRYHEGFFWIYVGDPDRGIFMTRARDARGPWEPLTLVKAAKGWIDPCPLWDDDGSMYLVHAWAKSRAGFNSVLTVNRMSPDGRRIVDDGVVVFDGRERHPTIEGPKFYKRNGWYYIFAPAGGVKRGWQTVLRSKSVFGPYEDKVVLQQGTSDVNGPHQGAWIDDSFVHFQDRGAYGRIVHRQKLAWVNDWPEIGEDGQPENARNARRSTMQTSDEFDGRQPGLQWQWNGNPAKSSYSLRDGRLRLSNAPLNLWDATNLLLQKFMAPAFRATTSIDPSALKTGERAGLVVLGTHYAALIVERTAEGLVLRRVTAADASTGGAEQELARVAINGPVQLRVTVAPEAVARFDWSRGEDFRPIGPPFVARAGRWVGAKVGLFGRADFDWFRVAELEPAESASFIVAQDGSGDFRTVQEAVDAIPRANDEPRTILVRNGTYREKVMIDRSYLALVGEDRDKTRIEFAELRRNWRANHPDDYGAAVINIADGATDITIANLTVINDYGRRNGGEDDHQFAIRSMGLSNRIAVLHANVIADGGDTLSLWNSESGLSYATDSYFEGHVDFVCPRGWSYITSSRFFARNLTAAIWHDGSKDRDQKLVIRNSSFDGVPGAPLGRNHRDAQFYLIDSTLSSMIADRPIYPAPAPDPRRWDERYYYATVQREGGALPWFADNLHTADGSPRSEDITAEWTFGGRWSPATIPAVLPFAAIPQPESGWRFVDRSGVTLRWTGGRNARTHRVHFGTTKTPEFRREQTARTFTMAELEPGRSYYWRVDSVTPTGIVEGPLWSFRVDDRTPRIALVGDSTVTEKSGWGRGFESHVAETAAVLNVARGGRSSKSYRNEGLWQDVLGHKPTHVLLQFGHNDVPGKGLDRETDLPTFRANLGRYVDETRAIDATPVLITPLTRRSFDADARIRPDLNEWAEATRQVATEKSVPLIDLHAKSVEILDALGPAVSAALGPLKSDGTLDRTHLQAEGSALFGAVVANELRRVVPALVPHLRAAEARRPEGTWSARMADSVMKRTPDATMVDAREGQPRWEYTPGLVMKAIFDVAQRSGDPRYWKYAKSYYDGFIGADGTIRGYKKDEYNIDRINPGKPLFLLYEKTKEEKYRKAIELLRQQMREHPRTSEGGFWHKKRYPWQMWLDGLYMGAPFLAQYANTFSEPALFDDVINQFVWMEKHARDEKGGLLHHGWDESRKQKWADPETGKSPAIWGRAMGWYAMGLVETLDYVPLDHPRRGELIAILQRLAEAAVKAQDPKSGVWWQVLDQPGREGNYLEASVSVMFTFALLKATRLRYIDEAYEAAARRAYEGVIREFIEVDKDGMVNIHKVCEVAGLGGDPEKGERYRSGTYEYYVAEKVRSNDPKAVGPFIFASLEMERRGRK